jgi:hydrogenase maturation protease
VILVIGYGNPLRGDDGVGWAVTGCLEGAPDVEVVATQMLVPELAERIGAATAVIFVDASVGAEPGAVRCTAIASRASRAGRQCLGHVASPEVLLDLVGALSDRRPSAFIVTVTGATFEFREGLSVPVLNALPETARTVTRLIELSSRPPISTR